MARPRGSTGPGRGKTPGPASRSRGAAGRPTRPSRSTTSSSSTRRPGQRPPRTPSGAGGSRFTARAVILLLVMLLLILSYTASLNTWWQQRQEIRATEAEIEIRKTAIAELEDDAERWDDPAYIEQQARARFGWVLPGEVGYRVVDADGEVEGDVPQLAEPPSEKAPEWYEKLWDSTKVAGQEPVEPVAPPEDPNEPLQQEEAP